MKLNMILLVRYFLFNFFLDIENYNIKSNFEGNPNNYFRNNYHYIVKESV